MTTQHEADRERIAGEMCKAQPGRWWVADEFHELGNAVRAFKTLCEPMGWSIGLDPVNGWYAVCPYVEGDAIAESIRATGDHARDVCALVCKVLDHSDSPENQCPECRTLMVRSGKVWKCLNCGAEKEPRQ